MNLKIDEHQAWRTQDVTIASNRQLLSWQDDKIAQHMIFKQYEEAEVAEWGDKVPATVLADIREFKAECRREIRARYEAIIRSRTVTRYASRKSWDLGPPVEAFRF